ncbi:MAG TPA: glycogen-binding domain-containing protein [Nitrospira sp.]|nr:glycogen-binding domain-containing protein [Nitrospira sp.]
MKEPGKRKASLSRPARTRKTSPKEIVWFEYFDPAAEVVAVVGEFNKWTSTVSPLKRDPGGLWKVKIRLAPGTYQYKFVVNGERWEEDPLNLLRVVNEHGTFNSIREVGKRPEETCAPDS